MASKDVQASNTPRSGAYRRWFARHSGPITASIVAAVIGGVITAIATIMAARIAAERGSLETTGTTATIATKDRVLLIAPPVQQSTVAGTVEHHDAKPPKTRPASTEPTFGRPQPRPRNASKATTHDEISIDEHDKALPEVVAAADDALNTLRSELYTVRGHLRSNQSLPDEGLQGLITTDLTLDVTLIDAQGVVRDAFTITSRGGGFTSDISALQARQRLREVLHEHRSKEYR